MGGWVGTVGEVPNVPAWARFTCLRGGVGVETCRTRTICPDRHVIHVWGRRQARHIKRAQAGTFYVFEGRG